MVWARGIDLIDGSGPLGFGWVRQWCDLTRRKNMKTGEKGRKNFKKKKNLSYIASGRLAMYERWRSVSVVRVYWRIESLLIFCRNTIRYQQERRGPSNGWDDTVFTSVHAHGIFLFCSEGHTGAFVVVIFDGNLQRFVNFNGPVYIFQIHVRCLFGNFKMLLIFYRF